MRPLTNNSTLEKVKAASHTLPRSEATGHFQYPNSFKQLLQAAISEGFSVRELSEVTGLKNYTVYYLIRKPMKLAKQVRSLRIVDPQLEKPASKISIHLGRSRIDLFSDQLDVAMLRKLAEV